MSLVELYNNVDPKKIKHTFPRHMISSGSLKTRRRMAKQAKQVGCIVKWLRRREDWMGEASSRYNFRYNIVWEQTTANFWSVRILSYVPEDWHSEGI